MVKKIRNLTVCILAMVLTLCVLMCCVTLFKSTAIAESKQYKAVEMFSGDTDKITTTLPVGLDSGSGVYVNKGASVSISETYIADNDKSVPLFSISVRDVIGSTYGVFVYIADCNDPDNKIEIQMKDAATAAGQSGTYLHISTKATGQTAMGLRGTEVKGNYLISSYNGAIINFYYNYTENALYVNSAKVRDYGTEYSGYGAGWNGFKNVESVSVTFSTNTYPIVITNFDGQSLAFDTTTEYVNDVKQIPYWNQEQATAAMGVENSVPPMDGFDYFGGVSKYNNDYQVEIIDENDNEVLSKQAYSSVSKFLIESEGIYTAKYYTADGETLIAEKSIIATIKHKVDKMFTGDTESISYIKPSAVNQDCSSLVGKGVFVDKDYSASANENITVEKVYLADNGKTDNLFSLTVLDKFESEHGIFVKIIDSANSENNITVKIQALNGGETLHISTKAGTEQTYMAMRSNGANLNYYMSSFVDGDILNFNYDWAENAMYLNDFKIREYDVANSKDATVWDGFESQEVSVTFEIQSYYTFISSVDGQSLAHDENGFVNQVKNDIYWDYSVEGTAKENVNIMPAKYFNFFEGTYDFEGDYQVEVLDADNTAVIAKTNYVNNLSFVPQTSGEYIVNYYFDGIVRTSIITVEEPILANTTLTIVNGAYVRVVDPIGIRFVIDMEKSEYDAYISDGYIVTLGVLIVPSDYIDTYGELSFDNGNYVAGENMMNIVGDIKKFRYYSDGETEMISVQAVNALKESVYKYTRAYTAVGYIKLEKGEFSDIAYTDVVSRSLYEISAKALASAGAEYYGESALQVLKDIVSASNAHYELVEYGDNFAVNKKATSNFTESNTYIPNCYFDLDTESLYVYDINANAYIKQ